MSAVVERTGPELLADQHAAFLRAILANRDDDGPRLVYADWLDEHGQSERAEFIRLQCRIAALEARCRCGGCVERRGGGQHHNGPCAVDQERDELPSGRSKQAFLRRREQELLSPDPPGPPSGVPWSWMGQAVQAIIPDGALWMDHVTFRRGFVASVALTAEAWLGGVCQRCDGQGYLAAPARARAYDLRGSACPNCTDGRTTGHADDLLAATPLERVRLTTFNCPDDYNAVAALHDARIGGRSLWIPSAAGIMFERLWPTLEFEIPRPTYHGYPMVVEDAIPADTD